MKHWTLLFQRYLPALSPTALNKPFHSFRYAHTYKGIKAEPGIPIQNVTVIGGEENVAVRRLSGEMDPVTKMLQKRLM